MTTKSKIIVGFLLMIALITGMAVFGYQRLLDSSEWFMEYRRLSRLNVGTSDLTTAFRSTAADIYHFADSRDPQYMDNVRKDLDNVVKLIDENMEVVRKPERVVILNKLTDDVKIYRNEINKIENSILDAYAQYHDVVRKTMNDTGDSMVAIAEQTREAGNVEALFKFASAWKDFALTRSRLGRFAESRDLKDGEEAKASLSQLAEDLKAAGVLLKTDAGKQ
ncbi:MAG: MCP four helix bundle domain-containing protein, partial [Betaproteobacteria bacterium]|nr:MCP four helix bundle domain-containing protein [Betaproteobacteria bacterium]